MQRAEVELSTDIRPYSFYKLYKKALNTFLLYFYIYVLIATSGRPVKWETGMQGTKYRKRWLEIDLRACFL